MICVVPHVARSEGMTVFLTNPPHAYAKKLSQGSAVRSIHPGSMPVSSSFIVTRMGGEMGWAARGCGGGSGGSSVAAQAAARAIVRAEAARSGRRMGTALHEARDVVTPDRAEEPPAVV